jgi:type II secretory pathway pseudopilin PulG
MFKKLRAFTLVEMLIVMGIIIILMAVGIASGRFAIRRANKIEHQNAAEQIYQSLQSYYSDNREFPGKECNNNDTCLMPSELITNDGSGPLNEFIDDFDGGSDASFSYTVDDTGQQCIVCVTYGGVGDTNHLGMYCTGNGIGGDIIPELDTKDLDYGPDSDYDLGENTFTPNITCSNWDPSTSSWDTVNTNCNVIDITEVD